MRRVSVIGAIAAAASLAACSEARGEDGGPSVQRSYPVGAFERIEVAGHYDVDVRTGAGPSVQATGPRREIERLVVEVRGDVLRIHPDKRDGWRIGSANRGPVRLAVTVPSLRGASMAGSGDISIDRIEAESFEGTIAGSGGLRVGQVEVRRLKLGIAGSGEARAQGRAGNAEYQVAGSGDIDAAGLVADTAAVSIMGSGDVRANAIGTAAVNIAGSGDVRLTGGAKCTVSKAGSGNVDCS